MLTVRRMESTDDMSAFDCGNSDLNKWVRRFGHKNQHRFGVTYVAVEDDVVLGFVTVAATSIAKSAVGGSGPSTWPGLLLGRMGVDKTRHGEGIGGRLLAHVFQLAFEQYMTSGCAVVVVDSKPESVGFYTKHGFAPALSAADSPSEQLRMYIAMETVLKAARPVVSEAASDT